MWVLSKVHIDPDKKFENVYSIAVNSDRETLRSLMNDQAIHRLCNMTGEGVLIRTSNDRCKVIEPSGHATIYTIDHTTH